jgi:HlyD family type I secretion membrane fusion protein
MMRPITLSIGPAVPGDGFRAPIRAGLAAIGLFFFGFGSWAAFAPLHSAAVAPGSVISDTKRKTIQHLEGGIVRDILVRDGDAVTAGQILVVLEDTQARATLQMVKSRYNSALALVARVAAEEADRHEIEFPQELLVQRETPDVSKLLERQSAIFNTKRSELESQIAILRQRDAQALEEIGGLEGQIKAQREQLRLLTEEIKDTSYLLERGLIQKPRLLLLQRQQAEIEGAMNQNIAGIARTRQSMGENRMRILELHTNRLNDAAKEHGDALKELLEFTDRLRAAEDVLDRTLIATSIDGAVMNLAVHTVGGVIKPGEPVLDVVPINDTLVVEARLDPKDIHDVRPGLPAQVRLTAFNQRTTPTLDGTVEWVSADRVDDEKQHTAYYMARVIVDQNHLASLDNVHLYPGMLADVMIQTGARTALDYLLSPVDRTFARAMREK